MQNFSRCMWGTWNFENQQATSLFASRFCPNVGHVCGNSCYKINVFCVYDSIWSPLQPQQFYGSQLLICFLVLACLCLFPISCQPNILYLALCDKFFDEILPYGPQRAICKALVQRHSYVFSPLGNSIHVKIVSTVLKTSWYTTQKANIAQPILLMAKRFSLY